MFTSFALALAVLACSGMPSSSMPPRHPISFTGLRCGTEDPTPREIEECRAAVERYAEQPGAVVAGGEIAVSVHVITCQGSGKIPAARVDDQIAELNRAFEETGFHFRLARLESRENCDWFDMTPGSEKERQAKEALADDPAHRLNLYVAAPGAGLLGWAYFPPSFPEGDPMHGVVVHNGSLPDGGLAHFDRGRTAVHEVGHYLGLFHTFQNGCVPPGDDVEDTPFEASPALGCPIGRNTCDGPGDDPIDNYMDYSDDACIVRFTGGQIERMSRIVPVYRPSLIGAPIAAAASARSIMTTKGFATREDTREATPSRIERTASAVWLEDVSPNPASERTVVSFSLARPAHVKVRAYDSSGSRIGTLLDRKLEAGDHDVSWRVHDQRAGIYTVVVEALGQAEQRIVIIER